MGTRRRLLTGDTDTPQARMLKKGVETGGLDVTLRAASGVEVGFDIQIVVEQSSTAGYIGRVLNVVPTSVGSGEAWLEKWQLSGVDKVTFDTSGNVKFDGRTTFNNASLTVDDEFYAAAIGGVTLPGINFDDGDFMRYDRATDTYEYLIGSVLKFALGSALANFQSLNVQTTGAFIGSAPVTLITGTSHTLVAANNGKVLVFTNAAAIAVTLPDGLAVNFHCTLIQTTASGVPTVTPDGADTLNGAGTGVAPSAQWKGMYLNKYDTAVWLGLI